MEIDTSKKLLRKKYLAMRDALPKKTVFLEDFDDIPDFLNAEIIFCYVSFGSEIATTSLLQQLLSCGKTVLVPRCEDKNGNMSCVEIKSLKELTKKGFYGIPEPEGEPFDKKKIDAAVVPGIAFDRYLYRLGYGKGYYDRFLADIFPLTVGLCHRELAVDSLPHSENDVKCGRIIVF